MSCASLVSGSRAGSVLLVDLQYATPDAVTGLEGCFGGLGCEAQSFWGVQGPPKQSAIVNPYTQATGLDCETYSRQRGLRAMS